MTGWGQDGPIAHTAGHDINYIALSGALYSIGPAGGPPVPPLNLIGDFGGGALYLAMGVLAGIISARATGKGQVIDCSMVEGSASLMMMMYGALAAGAWVENARQQPHRWRRALLPCLRDEGRRACRGRLDRAAILCAAAEAYRAARAKPARADRPHHLARHANAARAHLQDQDARGMDRDHGADRHLLRAGAAHVGSDAPSAQRPSRQLCRGGRHRRSRDRRRAFSARRAGCSARRRGSASTPTRSSGTGAFRPTRSPRLHRAGRGRVGESRRLSEHGAVERWPMPQPC